MTDHGLCARTSPWTAADGSALIVTRNLTTYASKRLLVKKQWVVPSVQAACRESATDPPATMFNLPATVGADSGDSKDHPRHDSSVGLQRQMYDGADTAWKPELRMQD